MSKDDFHVLDNQLADILEISRDKLYEVIAFFDSDPNDRWQLNLDEHFVWENKSIKIRRFSEVGALIIARYLDSIQRKSLWGKLRDWIRQKKRKTMQALVQIRITEVVNVGSLVRLNNFQFISKKQAVYILATTGKRFDQAFEQIRTSNKPLIIGEDFADIGGERYYSLRGFVRISRQLADKQYGLTNADRRLWCEAVDLTAEPVVKLLMDDYTARKKKIDQAVNTAKNNARKTCQVTGAKKTNGNPNVSVTGHHLYSKEHYPHLAISPDNILVITTDIHNHFHQWMGGTNVSCTIDDFIKYVTLFHPDSPVLQQLVHKKQTIKS